MKEANAESGIRKKGDIDLLENESTPLWIMELYPSSTHLAEPWRATLKNLSTRNT
jgi:hypothetical protein